MEEGKKVKGFKLPIREVQRFESLKERLGIKADDAMFSSMLDSLEGKEIEKPSEIPSKKEILEKAKEIITCPHYEEYPKDANYIKCHKGEKPLIRSKKTCEICNDKRTLYDEACKDLNVVTQRKKQIETELQAKETSLRTVGSEYNRIKKELETLREKRASFQVVPSAPAPSHDPMLMQRLKELENEISEKNQKIKDLEVREPAPAPASIKPQYEPLFQDPFDTEEILIETYEPLLPKAKAKYHQLIEEARKQGRKLTEDLLEEFSEKACE